MEYKKFNECKVGDTLYCIVYSLGEDRYNIVNLTISEICDGPIIERRIFSKNTIVIKEKVPNSLEKAGEYVIENYGESSGQFGIFTTYEEALDTVLKTIKQDIKNYEKDICNINKKINILNKKLNEYSKSL